MLAPRMASFYVLAIAYLAASYSTVAHAVNPNILFLMADQVRFDALGTSTKGAKTPWLDWLAKTGMQMTNGYSSTPTCTPARSAILTGLKPWYHGLLGYGTQVAPWYPYQLPQVMADNGYYTVALGKDHFGWNAQNNTPISHGYQHTQIYDGVTGEEDEYYDWFETQLPGVNPLGTGAPLLDFNSWNGAPYMFNESLHPTSWIGQAAVDFFQQWAQSPSAPNFFTKVSFHRPHSPYDPPERLLNATVEEDLPPIVAGGNCSWDRRFGIDNEWCGPGNADAW